MSVPMFRPPEELEVITSDIIQDNLDDIMRELHIADVEDVRISITIYKGKYGINHTYGMDTDHTAKVVSGSRIEKCV